jgi:DNA-binding CsgD family transcriptional regulator
VPESAIDQGIAALRIGDATAARSAFERVSANEPEYASALEGLGSAAYLDLDLPACIDSWERAYAAQRASGDQQDAVRIARKLAYAHGISGNPAVLSGWLARAQALLGDTDAHPERGWVALNRGMFESDRSTRDALLTEALGVARGVGDTDLEFASLAYLGASLVHGERTEEGMRLLDEALAAAAGDEVADFFILEEIFCQLFSACEYAYDVNRADQWMRVGDALAARRNEPVVSAFCRTHYGGILTAAGRWEEADVALTEAVRIWSLGYGPLRAGALVRLAELRLRQGRLDEVAPMLAGLESSVEAASPLAALHLARGDLALAADVVERALREIEPRSRSAAPLWALLVQVRLAQGDLGAASAAADEVAACAAQQQGEYLSAMAALAHGRVCLARGSGDALEALRDALSGFAKAQTPMELARARLELASAVAHEQPEVAVAEATTALDAFSRLHAARDADAAAALLRSLGVRASAGGRGTGALTRREAEVLDLLGRGLSNAEISDRLYISRKTVEHHVSHVLAKLGLRRRAEAAAYAAREGSATK